MITLEGICNLSEYVNVFLQQYAQDQTDEMHSLKGVKRSRTANIGVSE